MADFNLIPKIVENIKYLNNHYVEVGVMGGGEIQTIAFANEYGAKAGRGKKVTIPERSFFRSTINDDRKMKAAVSQIDPVIIAKLDGRTGLERVGAKIKAAIQATIRSNIQPQNAPATIKKKKGSRKTLIDTGRLEGAIDYEVH